jgi:TatD DNase family protein
VIDTHAHLDDCADPPEQLIARARAAGVDRVVAIGCGIESSRAALAVADREPGVYCVLGFHPHQAADVTVEGLAELRDLLAHPRAVGVGETGLDYFRDRAPRDRQAEAFRAQLFLAAELGKPVVVHTRAADEDTLACLAEVDGRVPVVLHCFSSAALAGPAIDRGYYVSFAGNVTYPGAADLRDAAARIAADRLLSETDCPYLAPQPRRGQKNEPAYVTHVVAALARARGEDVRELGARIDANASRLFGLP